LSHDSAPGDAAPDKAPPALDEARELKRLAFAMIGAAVVFALAGLAIVITTGDPASAIGALVMVALAVTLTFALRQLPLRPQRAAILLVVGMLAFVLFSAPIPPPVPALAAAPIVAVAFALSFLDGRRLAAALVAAWVVSVVAAIIIELTPPSPDLPAEMAAALRVAALAALVGLAGLVLYRHRRRLQRALAYAVQAADALRGSEERYRTVVEGIREVVFRLDGTGRAILLNEAWHELTGYEVADSIGRPIMDFVHPDEREVSADLSRPVLIGEVTEYRHELRVVGSDGGDIWVEAHARPLHDEAGNFRGMSGTLTNITARHELEQRLLGQAFHDELTGLANRALFRDRVEHALARRLSERQLVGLLFLDLDRFKAVNDSFGHTAGDRLLVAIAARLRAAIRPEDTIARFGGDEFAVLLESASSPHDVLAMAERISAIFDLPFRVEERDITVRSSIGVVIAAAGHRTADDLLRDADVAMYRAKVTGRGSYALFEPSMQAAVAGRLQLEADLREAIDHERLTLAYQPIVDLRDGRIVAVEALARWTHPERGEVPPSVFIPSAEESGLIVPLGAWILRRACLDLATLRQSGGTARGIRLNVNMSPRQLRDSSIVGEVLGALRGAGLKPAVLDLEITESLVLDGGPEAIEWLRILRSAGCGVAFDDFGTGFSSLGNLRTLPIDGLKIDISFVAAMLDGGVDAALVEAIIGLGAALGMTVVAEGVEDAATAARLVELGCPLAQGFHFGRPEPVAVLATRLAELARVVPAA